MNFHILVKGQTVGPLDFAALRQRVKAGQLTPTTFVWRPGMPDWKRAQELPELTPILKLGTGGFSDARPAAPQSSLSPISGFGEETRFFIVQAGLEERNPLWKKVLFGSLLVLIPAGLLWMLAALQVVPLEYVQLDEQGREVKTPFFSREGVSGLGDLLLGRNRSPPKPSSRRGPRHNEGSARLPTLEGTGSALPDALGTSSARSGQGPAADLTANPMNLGGARSELQAHYDDGRKQDVGPRIRARAQESVGGQGPSPEDIRKVVAQSQPAFQFCIEAELKRNRAFKGGRVHLLVTVAASGVVTGTQLDRKELEASNLGKCLKSRARRMVFSAFPGDSVDVEIPLILSQGL